MDLVKMSNLKPGELLIGDIVYRNIMYFPEEDPVTAIDVACAALIGLLYRYQSKLNFRNVDASDMLIYRVKRKFCDYYRSRNDKNDTKVIVMNSGKNDIFNTCYSEKQSALTKIWDRIYKSLFIDEFFSQVFFYEFIKPLENHYYRHLIDSYAATIDAMHLENVNNDDDILSTELLSVIAECRGIISVHLKNVMTMEDYFKKIIRPHILDTTPDDPKLPFILHKTELLPETSMTWFNWISYYESCVTGNKIHYYNGLLYETSDGTWKWRPLYEPITKRVMGKTLLSHVCAIDSIDTTAPNSGILFFNRNIDEITFDTYEHAIDFLKI